MLFGDFMLAFFTTAVDDRDAMSFRITTHPTAESSSHPYQVRVIQFLFRSVVQPPPPGPKPARRVAQSKVGVQNDTVHAVVAAIEKIAVVVAEFIGIHGRYSTTAQLRPSTARRAIFSEHSLRKSVDSYLLNVRQNHFNKVYRAKTPRAQRKISSYLSELGVLCVFARVIFFPIPYSKIQQFQNIFGYNLVNFVINQEKNTEKSERKW
jgi:hypothetical protein